jgi:hypothetical protein
VFLLRRQFLETARPDAAKTTEADDA